MGRNEEITIRKVLEFIDAKGRIPMEQIFRCFDRGVCPEILIDVGINAKFINHCYDEWLMFVSKR